MVKDQKYKLINGYNYSVVMSSEVLGLTIFLFVDDMICVVKSNAFGTLKKITIFCFR